jgi:hypothetical protein
MEWDGCEQNGYWTVYVYPERAITEIQLNGTLERVDASHKYRKKVRRDKIVRGLKAWAPLRKH